jgi:hypothetical protein
LFFIAKKEAAAVAKVADAGSASGKKRVKRDKDAPKKPLSPFFCYQAIRRPLLIAEQPTLKNTEIIKVSTPKDLTTRQSDSLILVTSFSRVKSLLFSKILRSILCPF